MNTVVLRTQVTRGLTLRQLLKQISNVLHSALENQELPFEHLVPILKKDLHIRRGELFRVMLMYQDRSFDLAVTPGTLLAPFRWQHHGSDADPTLTACDLVFKIREMKARLIGTVHYKMNAFSNPVVKSMGTQLTTILKCLSADREATITSLQTGKHLRIPKRG
jgi:non-ribosomal peptide synthetase component F